MIRHRAQFEMTPQAFEDVLCLPKNVAVVGIEWDYDHGSEKIRVYIESPDFEPTPEGMPAKKLSPVYMLNHGKLQFLRWE